MTKINIKSITKTNNLGEEKYIKILKYLTYQNIKINNYLLTEIYRLSKNKNIVNKKINSNQRDDILRQINIFSDICEKHNIDYMYYILIIESINRNYIKNIFRLYNYKYIRLYNENKKFNNLTIKYFKWKYDLNDFNKTSNPKKLLLELLEFIKKKDPNSILFFISSINLFFT